MEDYMIVHEEIITAWIPEYSTTNVVTKYNMVGDMIGLCGVLGSLIEKVSDKSQKDTLLYDLLKVKYAINDIIKADTTLSDITYDRIVNLYSYHKGVFDSDALYENQSDEKLFHKIEFYDTLLYTVMSNYHSM